MFLMGAPSTEAQDIQIQRDEASRVLRTRLCGVCHIPPGNEKALRVFNLDQNNWFASLSDQQLLQFKWRIKVNGEEIKEQRGDPRKHAFTPAEIKLIAAFVDKELEWRSSIPPWLGQPVVPRR